MDAEVTILVDFYNADFLRSFTHSTPVLGKLALTVRGPLWLEPSSPTIYRLYSPRARRVGPSGPRAKSARTVTGRRCPHSGVGEEFLVHRPGPLTKTGVTRERKVVD